MHTYTWKVVISSGLVTPETLCSLRISDSIPSNMPLTHTSSAHSSYTFMFRSRLRASRCHCEKRFADSAQQRSWLASIDATRVNEENLVDCQIVDIFSLSLPIPSLQSLLLLLLLHLILCSIISFLQFCSRRGLHSEMFHVSLDNCR